ncbi:deoxynucleoside kinase [Texcoconibacillus texcoconensis]|uniref:Deoxyguanosine kinase n=1 Tax=Texcoconibacillus texcoconensis TaxID=1095777 RepID=A0A840QQL4_9BACI|nr:deoxynucleoside kinase [Texcoconibacillus texcoconensis]MBB5173621.1 deoxyguanosine kinase [Texcoconibacillus texcoconensis]
MNTPPFISVEGPIGVGKTSLATKISERLNIYLLKEIVEENPFLGKFYEDIDEWSFQTEMFFLCNRYKQLEDIERYVLQQGKMVVSDYHVFKNLIFAEQTLQQKHAEKYRQIYNIITGDLPRPNVIIYLNASLSTLLERIEQRGRAIEKPMDPNYLKQLSDDYETFMNVFRQKHPHIPVLSYDGDQLDFIARQNDLETILDDLIQVLKKQFPGFDLPKQNGVNFS